MFRAASAWGFAWTLHHHRMVPEQWLSGSSLAWVWGRCEALLRLKLRVLWSFLQTLPLVWLPPSFLVLNFLTGLPSKSFYVAFLRKLDLRHPLLNMVSTPEVFLLGTSFQAPESQLGGRKITFTRCRSKRQILDGICREEEFHLLRTSLAGSKFTIPTVIQAEANAWWSVWRWGFKQFVGNWSQIPWDLCFNIGLS